MAIDESKKSYPRIPAKNWWDLRKAFNRTMPSRVTTDYLQSVLGLTSTGSAQNLVGPLRALGLIDDAGQPTDLAADWRADDHYAAACQTMLAAVYPRDLVDPFPPPEPDRATVAKWFARNTKTGDAAARQMAAMYVLLARADPGGAASDSASVTAKTAQVAKPKVRPPRSPAQGGEAQPVTGAKIAEPSRASSAGVAVNLNIQLTLPEATDPAVYDAFFAAMKKHLLNA